MISGTASSSCVLASACILCLQDEYQHVYDGLSPFSFERRKPVFSIVFQVFLHPNSAPLWREYLLFTQSYFSSFTVSKVNAAYGKCLSTLSAVRDGSMVSHPALPGVEEDMLGNGSRSAFTHLFFLLRLYRRVVTYFSYSALLLSLPSSVTFVRLRFLCACSTLIEICGCRFFSVQISSPSNAISCVSVVTQKRRFLCSRP